MKAEGRPDIRVALWEKFVLICGLSGLTALTRLPIGAVLACGETRALYRQTMEETLVRLLEQRDSAARRGVRR